MWHLNILLCKRAKKINGGCIYEDIPRSELQNIFHSHITHITFVFQTWRNVNTFDRWKCVPRLKQHVASHSATAFERMDWGNMVLLFCNGRDLEFVAQNIACLQRLMMPSHHSDSYFTFHVRTSLLSWLCRALHVGFKQHVFGLSFILHWTTKRLTHHRGIS